ISMILSLARSVHNANFSLRIQKQWERKKFLGVELRDKTLGIIGFGHVGRIVARIARKGLLMNVIAYDSADKRFEAEELDVRLVSIDEIFVNSDFISVHVPLIEQTKNMIGEREFDKMKNGVFIVNAARGGIINESALYNALKTGKVSGAGIDVWEKEPCTDSKLLELENVLALPHIGASTTEAQENVAIDIAKQIILAVENGKVENSVNGVLVLR
ncbi:MAG: NAD(P)-dependent oxidoreductase, partial [Nanoarchaeota archaeon]